MLPDAGDSDWRSRHLELEAKFCKKSHVSFKHPGVCLTDLRVQAEYTRNPIDHAEWTPFFFFLNSTFQSRVLRHGKSLVSIERERLDTIVEDVIRSGAFIP